VTAAALSFFGQNGDITEPRLMRTPAIYGDTVVFSYAGDLWVTKTKGNDLARRLTSHPGVEIRPKISPDGKWVAFTGQYDGGTNIYVIPIDGGEPKRLTFDAEPDSCLGWTPDGKIAYSSVAGNFINRQARLWLIDPKGGLPIATKINEISELSYFPDGKAMAYTRFNSYAFNWRHYRGGSQGKISFYNFFENKYTELPSKREQSYFPMIVGREVYFISDKDTGTLNLFAYNMDRKTETQITKYTDEDIRYPSTDGKTIVFERDGFLFTFDIATRDIERLSPHIASENLIARPSLRPLGTQITSMAFSPSGVRLAVEARGQIFSVPVKQGDTRNLTETPACRSRYGQWSPDGKTIAYMSDATGQYEIYTKPQAGGEATQLTTNSPFSIQLFEYLPDGKSIGITTADNKYLLLDLASKQIKPAIESKYGFSSVDASPDSKWLVYTEQGPNQFSSVYLYEIATGKRTRVTDGFFSDSSVSFDLNGKYLYVVSDRAFAPTNGTYEFSLKVDNTAKIYVVPLAKSTVNPLIVPDDEEPVTSGPPTSAGGATPPKAPVGGAPVADASTVKIDLEGLGSRFIALPISNGSYPFVLGANNGAFYFSNGTLMKFDLTSREASPILPNVFGTLAFNLNRTKIAYRVGSTLGVIDAHPGNSVGQGKVDTSGVEAVIDPHQEWSQIFWEAWRFEKDHYYDQGFRGLNWLAIGKHYHEYLKYVNNRADLNYVLGLMLAELGTSHSYVMGGDFGTSVRMIPIGHLGADYEAVASHIRFKKIYRGLSYDPGAKGPLGEPGVDVNEGDYLLEIDGKPVDANTNPDAMLLDKVGRGVTITVNSAASLTGARKVRVFPISTEMQLRYTDFVEGNRKKVTELSGGRIGYMHISDTATQGSIDFVRGFYPQIDKDAMIVDERWNGGGFIQPWFVDTLARKVKAYIQPRNGSDVPEEAAIEGPKAMLINGYAGSGGDFFPWMFKQARLGPLIGKRTWGGLVGISGGADLVDGGTVTSPSFSIYDRATNEIIAENHGIDPDIDVDNRPDLVADGQDPQLEAAVKYLLQQLDKVPQHKERTKLPTVNKDGKINP
jgi:tricorn protease